MMLSRYFIYNSVLCLSLLSLVACSSTKTVHVRPDTTIRIEDKEGLREKTEQANQERLGQAESKQPVDITSDEMLYREEGKITVFKGHVNVKQGGMHLKTPKLELQSDQGLAMARHGIHLVDHARGVTVQARELDYKRNLSYVIARKNVRLQSHDDQGFDLRLRCEKLEWHTEKGEGLATDNVIVHYKDTTATAGVIHFYQEQKELIMNAHQSSPQTLPEIFKKKDRIVGETITLKLDERAYVVKGRAKATILPKQESSKTGKTNGNKKK